MLNPSHATCATPSRSAGDFLTTDHSIREDHRPVVGAPAASDGGGQSLILTPGHSDRDTLTHRAGGSLPIDHDILVDRSGRVDGPTSLGVSGKSSKRATSQQKNASHCRGASGFLSIDNRRLGDHSENVDASIGGVNAGGKFPADQRDTDNHSTRVGASTSTRASGESSTRNTDHGHREAPNPRVSVPASASAVNAGREKLPSDALLLILADAVDDLEHVRIATTGRLRSLRDVKGLSDGPEAERLESMAAGIATLEKQAIKDLQRAMRAHPLGGFVRRTVGIGEKQAARLIAAIGDPAERSNPAKLWQYAGHGDPARSHCRKGRPVEHSPAAKMRTRLCAESCIKQMHSPYRPVYDAARTSWADRETSDGHKHNHALRLVGKAILKDLWREARGLSEAG